MENYLVVNLGLKSIRIIVFNQDGQQIYVNSKAVYSRLKDNRVEQNAIEWTSHLKELMSDLKENTSLSGNIRYVTSTTSSSCIYGVDKNGDPTTRVMMVSDKRSKAQVDQIVSSKAFIDGSKKHGFKCSTSSTIPKILWYQENKPEIYAKTHKWLGAGEFIHYFFTKEFIIDPLNAGKAFYNGEEYDSSILSEVGIDSELLPKVLNIGDALEIPNSVSSEYSLPDDCQFVITTYDAICAVIGSYDGSNYTACDVSGTVTSVRVLTDKKIESNPDSVILSQELGIENKRLIGASNNMGGGIIEWCKQAFYDVADKNVYYSMENNAQNSSVGAKGIIFLPYLLGERAPFKSVNAKATFFGVSRYSKKEDFTRAVLESTAFVTNDLLNLSIDAGLDIDAISVSGGLARFDLVNQIKADVTNRKVLVLENFESTSIGAFILMAISIKKYSTLLEASNSAVRIRKIINPSEKNHEIYREYFKLFKEVNETLLDTYNRHKDILTKMESYSSETLSNL